MIKKAKCKDKLKDTLSDFRFLTKPKAKSWDCNKNYKLKWSKSKSKDRKLMF